MDKKARRSFIVFGEQWRTTTISFWRNQEIERGNLAAARNHEQTWGR